MVRFTSDDVYFKDGDVIFYKDIIIKVINVGRDEWLILNTSNGLKRRLTTIGRREIYLDLIENFISDIGINLEEGEHLQFVDDTNENVR